MMFSFTASLRPTYDRRGARTYVHTTTEPLLFQNCLYKAMRVLRIVVLMGIGGQSNDFLIQVMR